MIKLFSVAMGQDETLHVKIDHHFGLLDVGPAAMEIMTEYNDTLIALSQKLLDLLKEGANNRMDGDDRVYDEE